MSSNDEDYINTQIFDTNNTGLKIAQDVIVTGIVSSVVQDAAEDTIYHLGGKQSLKALSNRAGTYVTMETAERIEKMTLTNLTNKIAQGISKIFASNSLEQSSKILGQQGAKIAANVGSREASEFIAKSAAKEVAEQGAKVVVKQGAQAAARSATITAGGCALGPAGCAAGAAISMMVFIADMAFTIYSAILDIKDTKGFNILWHKDFVDNVAEAYKQTLVQAYAKMGKPNAMDEEVLFWPEAFIYDVTTDNTLYLSENNEWAVKYNDYIDEYMKNTAKVKDGWRERLDAKEINTKDQISQKIKEKNEKTKLMTVATIGAGVLVFVICVVLIFLLLII